MKKVKVLLPECHVGSDEVQAVVHPAGVDDIDLKVLTDFIGGFRIKRVDLLNRDVKTFVGAKLAGFVELCRRLGYEPSWDEEPTVTALTLVHKEALRRDRFDWGDMRLGPPVFRHRKRWRAR